MARRPTGSVPHTVVRSDGVELHYWVAGSAPRTTICLHGLAGHCGEWEATATTLQDQVTTISMDQRGHGHSTRRPGDLSREAFAGDVAAVLADAGVTCPVTLVGQSMGAHTAFVTAVRHPELVESLVMVEGDIGGGGETATDDLRSALVGWPEHFTSYEEVRAHFGGDNLRGRAWADGYEARADGWWPRFDVDVMIEVMAGVFAAPRLEDWADLSIPTLLVLAERSSISTERVDLMCELRPSTRRAVVADAGHDVHLEQPGAWVSLLRSHLARLSG